MKQEKNNQNKKNKFSDILSELRENNRELTYKEIQSFSDLSEENLAQFRQTWNLLSNKRKEMFFELLLVEFMSNTLMDFSEIALIGLNDEDPIIRRGSLKLLMDNRKSFFFRSAYLDFEAGSRYGSSIGRNQHTRIFPDGHGYG